MSRTLEMTYTDIGGWRMRRAKSLVNSARTAGCWLGSLTNPRSTAKHEVSSCRAAARRRVAVSLAALSFALAGCSSDEQPSTTPSPAQTKPTPTATASPAWSSAFSREELTAYRAALSRYTAYLNESESIWAAGEATPAAKNLLRKYYIPWQAYLGQLQRFERSHIRIARNAQILDSRAARIELNDKSATVSIQQCVDATSIGATQDGKPLANAFDTPQLVDIEMSKVGERWYITQPPTDPQDRPCGA